jgi:hypothetical protein
MAPKFVRQALGPLTAPVVRRVARRTQRKWGANVRSDEEALSSFDGALAELRKALRGGEFVLGSFSYADVTGAQLLGMVSPVVHPRIRMGPRTRARFTIPSLAAKFQDLLTWRDGLYAQYRPS